MAKQMVANPKIEICDFKDGRWIRIAATAVEDKNIKAEEHMLNAYPSLQRMYKPGDGNTEVLYLKDATATISSFTEEPRIIKF